MSLFFVAALTGHSGSGKSYASNYLEKKGISVIDGDDVARQVVEPGQKCLKELVREFGDEILNEDGTLKRKLLGDICFRDPKKKAKLDSITHPYIIERTIAFFDDAKKNGAKYCIVEAPAVIESGLYAICDKLILITSDEHLQIERIMARDGLTEEQAKNRIHAQFKNEDVLPLCDAVIENNGTLPEFENKLDELAKQLEEWFEG